VRWAAEESTEGDCLLGPVFSGSASMKATNTY
jgi:hypothetical protein